MVGSHRSIPLRKSRKGGESPRRPLQTRAPRHRLNLPREGPPLTEGLGLLERRTVLRPVTNGVRSRGRLQRHSGDKRLDNPVAGPGSSEVARRALDESGRFRARGEVTSFAEGIYPQSPTSTWVS